MYQIENQYLRVEVQSVGAELTSIFNKEKNLEYLWQKDVNIWRFQSPILFPKVSSFYDKTYLHQGQKYLLPNHGFARDSEFEVIDISSDSITLVLNYDQNSLLIYPFKFQLMITYRLVLNNLEIDFKVNNLDEQDIYFQFGYHPAFNINQALNTVRFSFDQEQELTLLSLDGTEQLIKIKDIELDSFKLAKIDTLIFKDIQAQYLKMETKDYQITFSLDNFKYLAFWQKDSSFICVEPWNGLVQMEPKLIEIKDDLDMIKLAKESSYLHQWKLNFK